MTPLQLILVLTPSWDAVEGRLQRFERPDASAAWKPVGPVEDVVVGRKGLGWGRGMRVDVQQGEPVKREGDKKAPAGTFAISSAFGRSAATLRVPYVQTTDTLRCVDDGRSASYNRIREDVSDRDWTSAEVMRRADGQYDWGIVVDHNVDARPGAGSCIFLHARQTASATAGCTAWDVASVEATARWLDAAKEPVLVQLPETVHARLQEAWELPGLQ